MGQKVNPIGIRLGITRDWTSRWYANTRSFPRTCCQDWQVREFLQKKLAEASVSRIHIERAATQGEHHDPHGPPGRRDRQEGRGHREACALEVAKLMGMARAGRAPQHRRDPQARARRAARRGRHRAAARAARDVPPRHEARGDEHDAHRRPGHEGARRPAA